MPDDKIQPSPGTNIQPTTPKGVKIGLPALQRRVAQAEQKQEALDPSTLPNRLVLILDDSGSMSSSADGKQKIEHLRDAIQGFLAACNFKDTSVAITTLNDTVTTPLDTRQHLLQMQAIGIQAVGSTPIAESMEKALMSYAATRMILVSDGGYTGTDPCASHASHGEPSSGMIEPSIAHQYAEAQLPCDCVHIGNDKSGEETLKKIAEITGGVFIKFQDVASFAKSFKYLSPALYGMLTSGQVSEAELGAKEVK